MNVGRILWLVKKEAALEWRNRSALTSMLVYVIGASFIVYYAFEGHITFQVWSAIFWIIALFSAINTIGKTFDKEVTQRFYYLRTVIPPVELILSKLIYNAFLVFIFELVIFAEMSLFFGIQVENTPIFLLTLLLGGVGISNLFTLFATITARTGNVVLLSVLGFPIILPLLLLILRLTGLSDVEVLADDRWSNVGAVAALDAITLVLSVVLFPYLWSE